MCQNCNQNNCGGCHQEIQICNQCQQESTCDCPISDLSTDCINYDQDPILYGSTTVVPKNTILSVALDNIVQFFKTKVEQVQDYLRIVNVGTGASVYAGDSLIGEKKIRKINTISPIVTITENTNDISLGIDSTALNTYIETNQKTYSATNVGTGASIYKDTTVVGDNTQFNVRKIKSTNSSVIITEGTDDINLIVDVIDTTYTAGTALSLVGTTFNNTAPDQTVVLTGGGITSVTGTYPSFTITTPSPDGSETKITNGTNTTVTGNGTTGTPYIINSVVAKNNVVNAGWFSGLDVGVVGTLSVGEDVVSASSTITPNNSIVTVNVANAMPNMNYYIDTRLEGLSSNLDDDNDVGAPVFRKISTTQFQIGFKEFNNQTQSLKVHIQMVAY